MEALDLIIYNKALGLDGTIRELIDWSYRYSDDYSDEALDEIARKGREFGVTDAKLEIPVLVKKTRQRENRHDGTLPYESMKLDKLYYGKISFSETKEYGEVEIYEDGDKVLLSITGVTETGVFHADNSFTVEEFMAGDDQWLERAVGSTLYYTKEEEV